MGTARHPAHVTVEHVPAPTDDARALIEELELELSGHFPAEQRHGLNVAQVFRPGVAFFVARLGGAAVGCGAVAFDVDPAEPGLAEVKRMYCRPAARGRGVARAVLARLEAEARRRSGVTRLALETGDVLTPAIRFYERAGFMRCEAFGAYRAMPPGAIARSVFLDKRIA
jgi:putative acetyltransferase